MASVNELGWKALRERLGYGARPNKYQVSLVAPSGLGFDPKEILAFCKGASIPERTMGIAEVFIQGRKIPIPGDAQYSNSWALTFYNDQNHKLRKTLEQWIEMLDSYRNHTRTFSGTSYWADKFIISQLDAKDQTQANATWGLDHCYPSEISSVDFGADSNDQVSEFTVTFTYAHSYRIK